MNFCPDCGMPLQSCELDGVVRKVCRNDRCGFVSWENPTPVVVALVQRDGEYILARNIAWPTGIFSLISGYLEKVERPQDAVCREVEEELGLQAITTRQIGNFAFPAKNQVLLAYEVKARGDIRLNHELVAWKALSRDELLVYDFGCLRTTTEIVSVWSQRKTHWD